MNRRKKIILSLLTATVCLLLCGCGDYYDVEERALVGGIAVDRDGDSYVVTLELLTLNGGDGEPSPGRLIVSGQGDTVTGAMIHMVTESSRRLYFGHCAAVFIGRDVATEGIGNLTDFILHDREINVSVDIMVVKSGKAGEIFDCRAVYGTLVSLDAVRALEETEAMTSSVKRTKVCEVIASVESDGKEPSLPCITVGEENGEKRFSVDGMAVFLKDRAMGFLPREESIVFLMMTGNAEKAELTVTEDSGKALSLDILECKTSLSSDSSDPTGVTVSSELTIGLRRIPDELDMQDPESVRLFEQKAENEIRERYYDCITRIRNDYHSDILYYGYFLYGQYPALFRALTEDDVNALDRMEFDVEIHATLSDTGLSDGKVGR